MIREGDRYEEIKQLGQIGSIHHFIQWVKKIYIYINEYSSDQTGSLGAEKSAMFCSTGIDVNSLTKKMPIITKQRKTCRY